eukprot:TRINITY_DN9980_c1_g1_i1.p4 TRINITY_DN9980_c1_g1~~TRINITY_DN9980_c1_g1_i1.p4  ORF type:complete len:100 (+),score=7.99 TRINITY_DN9980_c1_g1_i1:40-339(+)
MDCYYRFFLPPKKGNIGLWKYFYGYKIPHKQIQTSTNTARVLIKRLLYCDRSKNLFSFFKVNLWKKLKEFEKHFRSNAGHKIFARGNLLNFFLLAKISL